MQTGSDLSIVLNNITVSYDDNGIGTTPVIFIHGFPFNKNSWKPQVEFLKSSCRVINYDIRGFGNSTAGNEEFSIKLFADDLINFMDALKIDKAIVVGLSMGGYIILNAVERYTERLEAIILCDTQCIADTAEGKEKRFKTIEQIEASGLNEFTNGFAKNVFSAITQSAKNDIVEEIKTTILSTPPEIVIATLKALAGRSDTCSMLSSINIPALILCGNDDIITPPDRSKFINENIQGSKLHIIENAGHLSNLEQPEIVNKYLHEFIDSVLK